MHVRMPYVLIKELTYLLSASRKYNTFFCSFDPGSKLLSWSLYFFKNLFHGYDLYRLYIDSRVLHPI